MISEFTSNRGYSARRVMFWLWFSDSWRIHGLNDICNTFRNHCGLVRKIRDCVPPSHNALSYANRNRDAGMPEKLFWKVLVHLNEISPNFRIQGRQNSALPRRFKRMIQVADSTTIHLIANYLDWRNFAGTFSNSAFSGSPGPRTIWSMISWDSRVHPSSIFFRMPSSAWPDSGLPSGILKLCVWSRQSSKSTDRPPKRMTFITNNFTWSATSICDLYKARRPIEVFFKEIKQPLQLSNFMGYNENAVHW